MSAVDPFAGIGEGLPLPPGADQVEAGTLTGEDFEPPVDLGPDAPVLATEEEEAQLDAAFEAAMADEDERQGAEEPEAAPDPTPSAPSEDAPGAASPAEASLVGAEGAVGATSPAGVAGPPVVIPPDPTTPPAGEEESEIIPAADLVTPRRRGRPLGVRDTGPRTPAKEKIYLVFAQGTLDNGQPFWWVQQEVTAKTHVAAMHALWEARAEGEETISYHLAEKEKWIAHTALVKRVSRTELVVK